MHHNANNIKNKLFFKSLPDALSNLPKMWSRIMLGKFWDIPHRVCFCLHYLLSDRRVKYVPKKIRAYSNYIFCIVRFVISMLNPLTKLLVRAFSISYSDLMLLQFGGSKLLYCFRSESAKPYHSFEVIFLFTIFE